MLIAAYAEAIRWSREKFGPGHTPGLNERRDTIAVDPALIPLGQTMSAAQAVQAATPRKTLVGFQRVPLQPGEQKTVVFTAPLLCSL